jgi:alpha-beta hydrolase superfamily lysophospholipase
LIEDAIQVFDHHIEKMPESSDLPRYLLGISMGGAISMKVHLKQKGVWSGAIFLAPMVKIVDSMKPHPLAISILRVLEKVFPTAPVVPTAPLSDRLFKLKEKKEKCHQNPLLVPINKPRLRTALNVLDLSQEVEARLHEVTLPFIICHGKADTVTDPVVSQLLYNKSNSKEKSIHLYEDVWHSLIHDEKHLVDEIISDVINWLNKSIIGNDK